MKILGIDPGSHTTGYGIVEVIDGKARHIDNGCIKPNKSGTFPQKLHEIFEDLKGLLDIHKPDVVAIENIFVAKNTRSSLILGHARGAAMLAATSKGLEVAEYTPAEVKMAITGSGRADKEQIQKMVKAILGLPEVAMEDASDALAIAICHGNSYKMRAIKQNPENTHQTSLHK